jgi:hypothetical protein
MEKLKRVAGAFNENVGMIDIPLLVSPMVPLICRGLVVESELV